MKASRSSFLLLLLGISLFLMQCDTTSNVKSTASGYFIKYFGNEGSQTGIDFVVDTDGSFILFGTTQKSSQGPRFYLVKADSKGNFMWEKTFGTFNCQARDVELANDGSGNIIVLGNMIPVGRSDYDVYLKRFSPDGTPKDSATLGIGFLDHTTNSPANENVSSVSPTNDGGFTVAGYSGNLVHTSTSGFLQDPLLLRFDDKLQPYDSGVWPIVPSVNQGHRSGATKIIQMPDSTFYVFGYSSYKETSLLADSDLDFWYFHISNTGGPLGEENYSPDNNDQILYSVFADTTKTGVGFILGGLQVDATGAKPYFTKLSPPPLNFNNDYRISPTAVGIDLGQLNTILNPPYPSAQFVSVAKADKGLLILTNEVTNANSNIFLMKIDNQGNTQGGSAWGPFIYGGQGDDFAGAVQELQDGKIVMIGTMTIGQPSVNNGETKMVLIKVNKDGQFAD